MKKLTTLCLLTILTSLVICGQDNLLNGPEGIDYDPSDKSYYVTNANDGKIIRIDNDGICEVFYEGLSVPMGIMVMGDSVFITSNDPSTVSCIDKITGELIDATIIPGSNALSHFDCDQRTGYIYIVDQYGMMIKYDTRTLNYNIFVAQGGLHNGITTPEVDTANNRILVFSWPTTFVKGVSINDSGIIEDLVNPQRGKFIDCVTGPSGYIYASTWSGNRIYMFSSDMTTPPVEFASGFNQPAGLVYNPDIDMLVVCNFGDNTLDSIALYTETGEFQDLLNPDSRLFLFPNPVGSCLNINYNLSVPSYVQFSVYSISGKEIFSSCPQYHKPGPFKLCYQTQHLLPGNYFISLCIDNKDIMTKKFTKLVIDVP